MKTKAQLEIIVIVLISLFIVGIIILAVNFRLEKQCKSEAEIMGVEWKYNIWIDCMIKVDDKWIKIDNYIINKEEGNP